MKKLIFLLIMIPIWIGCSNNNDDDGIDCALFDPALPSLFIRIVDSTGANLIENGTIDPDNLSVEGRFSGAGFQFIPANEFANPDADIRELDNSISLFIPYEPTFQYIIHLDDMETIKVDFTAELTRIPCDITYYKPIEGVFNNEALELTQISSLQFLAIIEL
jgi:hypothetical protein